MAAFYSTVPDSGYVRARLGRYRRRLIPLDKSFSLDKTGYFIDDINHLKKEDLGKRRKVIKESLFKKGRIVEYGKVVNYDENSNHPIFKELRFLLRILFTKMTRLLSSWKPSQFLGGYSDNVIQRLENG